MRASPTMVLALLPALAAAQTYKWKDASGNLHFTQVPPRTGAYEQIGAPPPPQAAPNQDALNEALAKDVQDEPQRQQAAEQAAAAQAQKQEACRQARERIVWLDEHTPRRLATTDAAGTVSRMTQEEFDRQRAAELAKADANC